MNYTDQQLQLVLAKMLPEKIEIHDYNSQISHPCFMWSQSTVECGQIKDTEWLHVCWLIERELIGAQCLEYAPELNRQTKCFEHITPVIMCMASWQQRAIALAKVKGVEIV